MKATPPVPDRVRQIPKSAIHEMTRLSKAVDDVAFLSWAKPTMDTPAHIKEAAISAIQQGLVGGYSEALACPSYVKRSRTSSDGTTRSMPPPQSS
jgi:aspartate/methionine/tyrosine aminotransferase